MIFVRVTKSSYRWWRIQKIISMAWNGQTTSNWLISIQNVNLTNFNKKKPNAIFSFTLTAWALREIKHKDKCHGCSNFCFILQKKLTFFPTNKLRQFVEIDAIFRQSLIYGFGNNERSFQLKLSFWLGSFERWMWMLISVEFSTATTKRLCVTRHTYTVCEHIYIFHTSELFNFNTILVLAIIACVSIFWMIFIR